MLHSVPPEFDIKEPINHKTYLIDGKIGKWDGEYSEVKSTILSSKKNIPYKLIGQTLYQDAVPGVLNYSYGSIANVISYNREGNTLYQIKKKILAELE